MSGNPPVSAVSPFVAEWLPRIVPELGPGARALDLAMGEGRHAVALAAAGFATFGVDRAPDRMSIGCGVARECGRTIHAWAADLDTYPLPTDSFDVLVCTRFLLRARWAELRSLVRPGGFVLYETFTDRQPALGSGPRSPDHLLRPRELAAAFAGWTIWHSRETETPAAIAQLVARKPRGPS